MAGSVVPLPRGPGRADVEASIRDLARETGNIVWEPKFRMRLRERGFTIRQALTVMREGHVASDPKKDDYGEWRCLMRKRVSGRMVRVAIAMDGARTRITAVTIY